MFGDKAREARFRHVRRVQWWDSDYIAQRVLNMEAGRK